MSFEKINIIKNKVEKGIDRVKILALVGMLGLGLNTEAQNNEAVSNPENIKNNISLLDSYTQENGKEILYEGTHAYQSINEKYKKVSLNNSLSIMTSEDWIILSEDNGSLSYIDNNKDGILDRIVKITSKKNLEKLEPATELKKHFYEVDKRFHEDIIPESVLDIYYLMKDCKNLLKKSDQIILDITDKEFSVLDYRDGSVASGTGEEVQEYIDKIQERYIKILDETAQVIEK